MRHKNRASYSRVIRRQIDAWRERAQEVATTAQLSLAKAKLDLDKATSSYELAKHLPKNSHNDLLFEIGNQALHTSTDTPTPLLQTIKLLISPGTQKLGRSHALIQLTHRFLPGITKHYAHRTVNRISKLSPNQPRLIAHGNAHNIFLVSTPSNSGKKGKQHALKVNVHSQRVKSDYARQSILESTIADVKKIHSWFGHIKGFLPKQQVVILNSPPMNRPAVVTIQPYIEGEQTDLFSLSEDKLIELLECKPYLKPTLIAFANQVTRTFRRTHQATELAGDGNLVFINKSGQKTRLMLLDANYIITPARSRSWNRSGRSHHYAHLNYLKKIAKQLR